MAIPKHRPSDMKRAKILSQKFGKALTIEEAKEIDEEVEIELTDKERKLEHRTVQHQQDSYDAEKLDELIADARKKAEAAIKDPSKLNEEVLSDLLVAKHFLMGDIAGNSRSRGYSARALQVIANAIRLFTEQSTEDIKVRAEESARALFEHMDQLTPDQQKAFVENLREQVN